MSVVGSQQRTLLQLLLQLRPNWRTDRNLPARIQALLARNRSFGSRDRRLYRELVYTAIRYLPWIEPLLADDGERAVRLIAWLAADVPATAPFRRELVSDLPACPDHVIEKAELINRDDALKLFRPGGDGKLDAADLLPGWLSSQCPAAFLPDQMTALLTRAPLWLRLNRDTMELAKAEFDRLHWPSRVSAVLPTAVQLLNEVDVTRADGFNAGWFEVQDLGSQLLLASAKIEGGGCWLDACAGAGGKTLQLSALLGETGRIDAFDIRRAALDELEMRARRARATNINLLRAPPTKSYDGVLVDAPCTGSGTWRRAPHLKWSTTIAQVAAAAATQRMLLAQFAERVNVGGHLLYATCSINRDENEGVVEQFLATQPRFVSEPPARSFDGILRGGGLTFLPAQHDSDGFFIAAFRRVT
ncbi:MAG: RsmB/NOP family class I SAM-dependent RNA methyltransferase [Opitutus sp.]